eukprot:jgi/Orpsp1_1/1184454/evm.model.c7180000089591.1
MISILLIIGTVTAPGINLVNENTTKVIALTSNDANDTSLDSEKENLALFNCNSNKICKQTYGYIEAKDSTTQAPLFYSFNADNSTPAKISGSDLSSACASGDEGKIMSDGSALCIVGHASTPIKGNKANNKVYVISTDAASVFSLQNQDKSVIIKATEKSFYLDNLYSGKEIIVVKDNALIDTTGVTSDTDAKASGIYNCSEDGVCSPEVGFILNNNKHYEMLIDHTQNVEKTDGTAAATDYATSCTTPGELLKTGLCLYVGNVVPFVTTDETTKYYLYYASSEFYLVKAIKNIFVVSEITGADGVNIVNIKTPSVIDLTTSTNFEKQIIDEILNNLLFFNCDTSNSICKQTVGYLKSGDTSSPKYYKIGENPLENVVISTFVDCSDNTHAGGLASGGNVCLSISPKVKTTGIGDYIIMNPDENSIFQNENTEVLVADYYSIYNNLAEAGPKIYNTVKMNLEAISATTLSSDKQKLGIFNCNGNGTCQRTAGFVSDGDAAAPKFYKITETNSNVMNDNDFVADCSSKTNIGKLLKDTDDSVKLCVNVGKSSALPASGETESFVLSTESGNATAKRSIEERSNNGESSSSSGYKLVRATENMFSIGDLT